MQIKTQRLKIRTLQDSDLNDVFDIYKNEETCKYFLNKVEKDKQMIEITIKRDNNLLNFKLKKQIFIK